MEESVKKQFTMNLNTIFIMLAIVAMVFGAGKSYGILSTLEVKIGDLENKIETFKEDYARKDVLETRLESIDHVLTEIKEDIRAIRNDE